MQYYAKLREDVARVDALNHIRTPISGFLGMVSSTHEVEYIDGTAFSVLPGGLLIDMKGITVAGSWRGNQADLYSDSHFEFIGHVMSSLEHEIWQELTGYDAVSTVRGIQMALAGGATLINPKKNATTDTLPSLYDDLGFTAGSAPSGFTYVPFTIFTTTPATWSHATSGSEFDIFKSVVDTNTASLRAARAEYEYGSNYGLYGWCNCIDGVESQLQSFLQTYGPNYNLGTQDACSNTFSGTVSQYLTQLEDYYFNTVIPSYIGQNYFDYFDRSEVSLSRIMSIATIRLP
jgi:hypothetical protein